MSRLPSLPERPVLGDVFKRFPAGVKPLLEYHDVLLRGPSPLTVAQRELLAAYVSGLNACGYCHGAHNAIAELHGVSPSTLETLIQDPVTAGVEPALLPLLAYVRKLTESPGRMVDGDASEVFAAGWDELALFHAISICALFNFMNRIVEGCGVIADASALGTLRDRHTRLKDDPNVYQTFGRQLGIFP